MKKGAVGANKITRDFSSSVIEKFNGYETIKTGLSRKEKEDFFPIDIIYDQIFDQNFPVPCYFTDTIHLAYRSYISKTYKREEKIGHSTVRQCHYCCENYFSKSEETRT